MVKKPKISAGKPLISVITPCYNAQAFLAQSIESILSQDFREFEHIIVNDGSMDSSLDILNHYAKKFKQIRIIDLKENAGMSNARNVGNKAALADIIAVQDADDVSYPTRLSVLYKFLKEHPKTDMVYSAYYVVNENDKVLAETVAAPFDINNVFEHHTCRVGHPTMAYRKKVILDCPYQNGQWSKLGCEDFRLVTELWKKGYMMSNIEQILVNYRYHDAMSTQTRDSSIVEEIKKEYIESYLRGSK